MFSQGIILKRGRRWVGSEDPKNLELRSTTLRRFELCLWFDWNRFWTTRTTECGHHGSRDGKQVIDLCDVPYISFEPCVDVLQQQTTGIDCFRRTSTTLMSFHRKVVFFLPPPRRAAAAKLKRMPPTTTTEILYKRIWQKIPNFLGDSSHHPPWSSVGWNKLVAVVYIPSISSLK